MGNKVNSNTMVNVLINTLNNKQSNMLTGFKDVLKIDFNGADFFVDGTYSALNDTCLAGTKPDIICYKGNDVCALIEVKVNKGELLEASQRKNGEYEKYSKTNNIPLYYFIPTDYKYESELPPDKKRIKNWDDILKVASEYDSNFANFINAVIEGTKNYTNFKLERIESRLWEVLARSSLKFDFGEDAFYTEANNTDFHGYINLNDGVYISVYYDGIYIGKDSNEKLIYKMNKFLKDEINVVEKKITKELEKYLDLEQK